MNGLHSEKSVRFICRAFETVPLAAMAALRKLFGLTKTMYSFDGGQVTCEAGKLPERFRAVARVLLQSCDGRGVSFGSEYVAVRAEIQEPTVRTGAPVSVHPAS